MVYPKTTVREFLDSINGLLMADEICEDDKVVFTTENGYSDGEIYVSGGNDYLSDSCLIISDNDYGQYK